MGESPEQQARPRVGRVRFVVLAFLAGLSFVLYLDRVCISQASSRSRTS